MKIAMIGQKGIPSLHGGIETHVEELSTRLARRGHQVTVYCRRNYTPAISDFKGVRVKRLPSFKTKHLDTITYAFLASMDSIFRSFDAVHFHALGPSIFSFLPRLRGVRTLVTVHALDWRQAKWGPFAKAFLKTCEISSCHFPHITVAVSKGLKEHLEKRHRVQVHHIPSGIREPEITERGFFEKYGLERKGYILFSGRLIPDKGVDLLIRVYDSLRPPLPLVIVGGGAFTEDYVNRLKNMAGEGVIFTGYLHGSPLWEMMENALLFILPSRVEGLSISLLEAMNLGLPVLASDIRENLEILHAPGGPYGFTFRVDDEEDLKEKLMELLRESRRLEAMAEAGRDFVRRAYSWDSIIEDLESLYTGEAPRSPSGEEPSGKW